MTCLLNSKMAFLIYQSTSSMRHRLSSLLISTMQQIFHPLPDKGDQPEMVSLPLQEGP